ncbi:MAG: hypothetical protein A3G49_00945 [Candidatus Sungbacteria bacterium RIFCSPLOWO2_12_FULL_41_11]|uniref:Uncharacterized protein n=1 Tax=Candidatus Sungbacteria bacterium RIFCSPLOWO2_12_FULL_41_11 TaxID=1802286 RepID=A0A1G2LPI4_9BACT|nr:MAG: hypothetical protein UV01_C0010G0093 [Parcubacteria group bacterium GW2011_GWA2_42_14]OGZ98454.1 MAG: hypothetical protein A3D41_05115 [Candidatus Sungbacteria bacterium RIFCSPHIGHO2_02_FULL_41_12b]OHA13548.1 MAG: hypothetical protein A3G49_00945 [Candidatus Sungbacteria bacterium RIFCSPLOWO2_12_FULL_41_11]
MSDAYSDIASDEERAIRYVVYANAVKDYLREPTDEKLQKTIDAAKNLDALKGWGYWSGPTSESVGLEAWLAKLIAGDEKEWANLIKGRKGESDFEEFKALSLMHNQHKNNWGEYI